MCRRSRQTRVDDDNIRPIEFGALEKVLQRYGMRLGRIATPNDLGFRIADIVEAVGHRTEAPGIGDAGDCGGMANASLVIGVVRSPESAEFAEEISGFIGELRRTEPIDRVGSR